MREVLAIVFLAAMTCTVTTAASGADAPKSRVWKVSDAAGLGCGSAGCPLKAE